MWDFRGRAVQTEANSLNTVGIELINDKRSFTYLNPYGIDKILDSFRTRLPESQWISVRRSTSE